MAKRIGILGASGYTGIELLRLLAAHPELDVELAGADSSAGARLADLSPSLAAAYGARRFDRMDPADCAGLDLVFCGLPHGASSKLMPALLDVVPHVVDLAADFRLKDASLYPTWYHEAHPHPELLKTAGFGLPELFRADQHLAGARLIAAPGCYVTTAALALAPFVRAGAVEATGIVVDAASGTSGAGRVAKPELHFASVANDFTAYGLLTHRHTPEIEQATGAQVIFTPHLAPMVRGILATVYARPTATGPATTAAALEILANAYAGEPFVVVDERIPSTKAALGSNTCHITARVDPRTGWLVAIAALDNLVKGASGQAIQCANLALGLPEALGLPLVGMTP